MSKPKPTKSGKRNKTGLSSENPIRQRFKKIMIKIITNFIVLSGFVIALFIGSVYIGFFGPVPSAQELKQVRNMEASQVISADGQLLGKFYIQDRSAVAYAQIAPTIVQALVATEDSRFYEHQGIDSFSLLRVLVKTILLQDRSGGGGSTITQQLVKNIYGRSSHKFLSTPINKIKEMIAAYRLEQIYSKEELVTMYLNTVPFGDNTYGIASASDRFFSKTTKEINTSEAAVLIGMLKANYTYNPRLFPENALMRRNVVLYQMVKSDYLSEEEFNRLKTEPLDLHYKPNAQSDGLATYFREQVRQKAKLWCAANTKNDGSNYNLYTDGLKIITTLDARLQAHAEQAMKQHMTALQKVFDEHIKGREPWRNKRNIIQHAMQQSPRYKQLKVDGASDAAIKKNFDTKITMKVFTWQGGKEVKFSPLDSIKHYLSFLQAGFIAIDPHSGKTKAWVGGIDQKYFQYDHASASTKRQVGSTFKPIVYAAALESGIEPCDYISAEKVTYKNYDSWTPENGEDNYDRKYSMKGALTNSVNTVAVNLLDKVGMGKTIALAERMGVVSDLPQVPSLALGVANLSLTELASVYSTFVNHGAPVIPYAIERIEDKNGKVLYENKQKPMPKAMTNETCATMTEMLKSVVDNGTASRLRWKYKLPNDMGGKTGTTQSNTDGWFASITGKLVMISWVGADNPAYRFRSTALGQGANSALPITALFLQEVNKDPDLTHISNSKLASPSAHITKQLDCLPELDDKNLIEQIFGKSDKAKKREFGDSTKAEKKGFFNKVKGLFKKKK